MDQKRIVSLCEILEVTGMTEEELQKMVQTGSFPEPDVNKNRKWRKKKTSSPEMQKMILRGERNK